MKKGLLVLLCIVLTSGAYAQFMAGLNAGYAHGAYYKKPYLGLGLEFGFLRTIRIGINADVLMPSVERTPTPLFYKDDNSMAEEGTTTTLKYFTFSPEFNIKRFFGKERENAFNGFYIGLGFSYKMFKYNQTVGDYNTGVYKSNFKAEEGTIKHPFLGVMLGYEFAAGPGNLGVELKADLPANESNGYAIEVKLPAMFKLGVTYRFGNFAPKW
ncbi:hypothetical protein DBR32_07145 [Taibaiella sp. KBW10]|uniref:hypothetical protein n=1 Tax=Taibaiella sp. KBW10 TaxID=2153357 RepID=UPI000F5917B1|nr:hypothetical protein [Taibaiella sp. KBW10]RQO31714.1 hypothetical protein DBR32_07145 [Taibaiella sp. KBW10]